MSAFRIGTGDPALEIATDLDRRLVALMSEIVKKGIPCGCLPRAPDWDDTFARWGVRPAEDSFDAFMTVISLASGGNLDAALASIEVRASVAISSRYR
eukprot:tig00021254_g19693.t1